MTPYDVAIVGAGIAGLSLAFHLQRAGKSVVILEKSGRAEGASTRNFGMIWLIGQPIGDIESLAFRSRELWQEAAGTLGFSIRSVGSMHLAYEDLETQVMQEFLDISVHAHGRRLLTAEEAFERCPGIRKENLRAALLSPTESVVDPRDVVHQSAAALSELGVEIRFDSNVTKIETGLLRLADGTTIQARKIVACPGPELFSLYPKECSDDELIECRLQMLRLKPRQGVMPLGIHLCAGLTLGHYANFKLCPSLPALLKFHRQKWSEQVNYGIHVLVSEHQDSSITVGDSHAYGRKGPIYREEAIDEAILSAMDEFLPRTNYEVSQRWIGTYNTHQSLPFWSKQVADNIWALNLFGTGMTLSFAVTELLARELG